MGDNEKLIAACWVMWAAIEVADAKSINGEYGSLKRIAKKVKAITTPVRRCK